MTMEETTKEMTNEEHSQAGQSEQEKSNKTSVLFDDKEQQDKQSEQSTSQTEQSEAENEKANEQQQSLSADDIKLPEGYEYDKELGTSFLEILNEAKVGKETAQKLFDLYQSQNMKMLEGLKAADKERVKKFEEDLKAEKAEWLKQCEADKEYGGQKWEASQAVIDRAARTFDGAVKVMQAYNLHTHPEIVRMFYRAGQLMKEDKSQIQGGSSGKGTDPAMAIFGESLKDYHKRRGDI